MWLTVDCCIINGSYIFLTDFKQLFMHIINLLVGQLKNLRLNYDLFETGRAFVDTVENKQCWVCLIRADLRPWTPCVDFLLRKFWSKIRNPICYMFKIFFAMFVRKELLDNRMIHLMAKRRTVNFHEY